MDKNTHERLLQTLSALLIQINALQPLLEENSTRAGASSIEKQTLRTGLTAVEQLARDALSVVRASEEDTLLPELEGVTLANALSRLVDETAETLNLSSRIAFSGVDEQGQAVGSKEHGVSQQAERLLFLVAREALYEVRQHSGARKLRLTLNYGPDEVQVSIEDDGVALGIPLPATITPLYESSAPLFDSVPLVLEDGEETEEAASNMLPVLSIIQDLRTRLEQLGGTLEISVQGERGTRVTAHVPYLQHSHTTVPLPVLQVRPQSPVAVPASIPVGIRLLVVDNQAVTRAGLRRLLDSYAGIQVVGEAADGVQAVSETLELGPQVVLMDSHLPNGQSMEALRQIKQLNLDTKVLLLSTQDREEYLYETLRAGADGYVLKDIAPDELVQAIQAVARGEVQVQAQLAGRLLSRVGKQGRGNPPYESLTTRELEVLRLLARGLRNKEIAARLYVSERTVNFHLANIYQKLNVSGRTEALSRALEQGLISA